MNAPAVRRSRSTEETEGLGEALAGALRPGDLIALSGPLGSGKTRFVVGLARGLAAAARVRSPTFTLVNEYPGRIPLAHLDLYRLAPGDADSLGIEDCLARAAVVVEWGEKLPAGLLADALTLEFGIVSDDERSIVATASGARGRELLAAWSALRSTSAPEGSAAQPATEGG